MGYESNFGIAYLISDFKPEYVQVQDLDGTIFS